jgi:hypothetical protein
MIEKTAHYHVSCNHTVIFSVVQSSGAPTVGVRSPQLKPRRPGGDI